MPPPSRRKYWTRRGIAEWLLERLAESMPTLVGIDHGFSFPLRYFEAHGLPPDWPGFLDDFQRHWPTDHDHTTVDGVRDGTVGDGAKRPGHPRWRRLTEARAGSAKSVFHFDVQGSTPPSGSAPSQRKAAPPTSMMPIQSLRGCARPISTTALMDSSPPPSHAQSARRPRQKAGFWESGDRSAHTHERNIREHGSI